MADTIYLTSSSQVGDTASARILRTISCAAGTATGYNGTAAGQGRVLGVWSTSGSFYGDMAIETRYIYMALAGGSQFTVTFD